MRNTSAWKEQGASGVRFAAARLMRVSLLVTPPRTIAQPATLHPRAVTPSLTMLTGLGPRRRPADDVYTHTPLCAARYAGIIVLPLSGAGMGYFGGKGLPFFFMTLPGASGDAKDGKLAGRMFWVHKNLGGYWKYLPVRPRPRRRDTSSPEMPLPPAPRLARPARATSGALPGHCLVGRRTNETNRHMHGVTLPSPPPLPLSQWLSGVARWRRGLPFLQGTEHSPPHALAGFCLAGAVAGWWLVRPPRSTAGGGGASSMLVKWTCRVVRRFDGSTARRRARSHPRNARLPDKGTESAREGRSSSVYNRGTYSSIVWHCVCKGTVMNGVAFGGGGGE